jgi:FxLD family lantipeptide
MTIQVDSATATPQVPARSLAADPDDLDLDVSIVEKGDAADVLLCTTDNGCNTIAGSQC